MKEVRALSATGMPGSGFREDTLEITIPRPVVSGDIDDTDVFGGQQYCPLVDLEVP